jgi:V/A-type H+-transporting ATPase subunit G/H
LNTFRNYVSINIEGKFGWNITQPYLITLKGGENLPVEAIQRITAAEDTAQAMIQEAHEEAALIKKSIAVDGDALTKEILEQARLEGERILSEHKKKGEIASAVLSAQGKSHKELLWHRSQERLDSAVQLLIERIVT